eukprot:scaffold3831_cov19-Tisochrysis_lutea.AAC.1
MDLPLTAVDSCTLFSSLPCLQKGAAPNGPAMLPAYLEAIVGSVASEADARVVHKLVRDVMAEFHVLTSSAVWFVVLVFFAARFGMLAFPAA